MKNSAFRFILMSILFYMTAANAKELIIIDTIDEEGADMYCSGHKKKLTREYLRNNQPIVVLKKVSDDDDDWYVFEYRGEKCKGSQYDLQTNEDKPTNCQVALERRPFGDKEMIARKGIGECQ